jgi:hypothetical protein
MSAVRDAIGLLRLGAVAGLAAKEEATAAIRVPESIANAKNDDERWEMRTAEWLERVNRTYPLKKDRSRTFITRRGRKVGLYAAAKEEQGGWKFILEDRPVNVLVLLAQDNDRYLHDFVLPPKVIQDFWKKFARSEGNIEIVLKKGPNGVSLATDESELPIQQYAGDYSALQ